MRSSSSCILGSFRYDENQTLMEGMISTKTNFFPWPWGKFLRRPKVLKNVYDCPIFSQHRAYLAKMQPIWDAEKAATAAKANRENMASFFDVCYSYRSWWEENSFIEFRNWLATYPIFRSTWRRQQALQSPQTSKNKDCYPAQQCICNSVVSSRDNGYTMFKQELAPRINNIGFSWNGNTWD